MKLTIKNTAGKKVVIRDVMGKRISLAQAFDTKTCMTTLMLWANSDGKGIKLIVQKGRDGNKVAKVRVRIPGAYAEINGKRVS